MRRHAIFFCRSPLLARAEVEHVARTTATGSALGNRHRTSPAEPKRFRLHDCHTDQETAFRANAHGHEGAEGEAIPNAVCESCHATAKHISKRRTIL